MAEIEMQDGDYQEQNDENPVPNLHNAIVVYNHHAVITIPFEGSYEGEVDGYGARHGRGKMTYFNGSVYEGQFVNNKKHGLGTFTWARGDTYVGTYADDRKNGLGKFTWVSGNRYVGDFVNDRRCGIGLFIWPDGEAYEGLFENDTRKRGCYLYNTGDRYVGEFQSGMRHGTGSYYYKHGDQYHGQFVRGFRDGKGTIMFANGNKYEGYWKADKRDGMGIFSWASGNRYEGCFVHDMRTGYGIYYYSDGLRYEGMFQDGKKHGTGILFKSDGSLIHQVYHKGTLVRKKAVTPFTQDMSLNPLLRRMKEHDVLIPSNQSAIKKFRGYNPTLDCKEIVLLNTEEVQHIFISTIFEGCKRIMEGAEVKRKQALYKLTDNELFALTLFAFDLGDDQMNIHSTINKILRENDPQVLGRWKGYIAYLLKAFDKLPNYSGIVFKGSNDMDLMQEHYRDKKAICWGEFISTSTKETSTIGAVTFRIRVFSAKDISPFCRSATEPVRMLVPFFSKEAAIPYLSFFF
eukprot:TRINITY_DN1017_c0_g1_i2.p1 TRINITY_DN1017_c0_g1~~TRINITY_DN1017_c0_g1_i2.p1  ORF type:complete len:517 (-),score=60.21 TRINITY_DN1017_c0_g1_i2:242-1792(-)